MQTIFTNAVFHTMEDAFDERSSMTVEDGRIVALDENAASSSAARIIDLQGLHVFPALIDAHLHMLETIALSSVGVQLCRIENKQVVPSTLVGIEEQIRSYAANRKPNSLIIFTNYISAAIDEHRLPTRFELDEWTGGARVWVLNIDGHSSSSSTALLKAVGLLEATEDGILVGPVHDANLGAFSDYLAGSISATSLAQGIADFCNTCASYGIGTVCAMEGTDDSKHDKSTELVAFLAQRFPLNVRLFPQYWDNTKLDKVLERMARKRVGGCMAWELDGSIGSRTAAFMRPYKDGSQGTLYLDSKTLLGRIDEFARRDFFISAHAIGELAIEQIVDILEAVPGRHRIDHCEFPSPEILERIYKLSPSITVQPGYAWIDKQYLHGYTRFLDDETLSQQIPLKDFFDHGIVLCGSSDAPVQSVDPYLQMRGMREFYVEDQSLSAYEALKTYTVNGGSMLGEKKGILRVGYDADFFTSCHDLLNIASCELEDIHAKALYLSGKEYKPLAKSLSTFARLLCTPARKI